MTPIELLKQAVKAVPAVKWAIGVGGIAAVVAIVLGFRITPQVAVFGSIIVLGLMFILVVFSSVAGKAGNVSMIGPATALVWFFTVTLMAVTSLFVTSYFWGWPSQQLHPASTKVDNSNSPSNTPGPIPPPKSPLVSGSVIVFNGAGHYGQSAFIFDGTQVTYWSNKDADIGVSNPNPNQLAMFFLMNNRPPYADPSQPTQDPADAGIADMHSRTFDDVEEAPTTGYVVNYFSPEVNHVYCVRTRDGHHYAKITVTDIENDRIAFDYVYQKNGTRSFVQ